MHLYLLDSNDIANYPAHRGITSELYGGGPELRLQQEIVLGIGGWRLLEALDLQPEVCHLNEGHAALAILDRARAFMHSHRVSFDAALTATRAGNVFTTHTAVPAGFDRFAPQLMEQYLAHYAGEALHISMRELLALGRENASDDLGALQHGLSGGARLRRRQRRQPAARRSQPAPLFAAVPALAGRSKSRSAT